MREGSVHSAVAQILAGGILEYVSHFSHVAIFTCFWLFFKPSRVS